MACVVFQLTQNIDFFSHSNTYYSFTLCFVAQILIRHLSGHYRQAHLYFPLSYTLAICRALVCLVLIFSFETVSDIILRNTIA